MLTAIVLCLAALALAARTGCTDLAQVKMNLLDFWTGAEADRADPQVIASLQATEETAREALSTALPDGSWADLQYRAPSGHEFQLAQHVSRVASMAEAFRTPGQALHQDPELAAAVARALDYAHALAGQGWLTSGGWWQQQVHIPRKLGETLLLMEGALSAEVVARTVQTIRYHLMEEAPRGKDIIWHVTLLPPDAPPGEAQQATGENMVWMALNHLYLALAANDVEKAGHVQAQMAGQCAIQHGPTRQPYHEGIKEDYSFHQHGALLYTGGYGRSFFGDVPIYLWATRSTSYQVPAEGIEAFARYALDSTEWCVYENYYDPSCQGREITRPERGPMPVPLALLVLASLTHPRQDDARRAVRCFRQYNASYQHQTAPLWAALTQAGAADAPLGHRHFWESDYTVHRGDGYFASLRMFSDRTRPAECISAEGKTSWHQANGLLWVFLRGGDYAANDVLPTLDWLRLPGITVERRHLEPAEGFEGWPPPLGHRAFVGGAFTSERGVSAMELAAMVPPLTARKSWFFLGDVIVALGSDIGCPSDNPAETTVNQWPLTDADAPLIVEGRGVRSAAPWQEELQAPRWAHCDGIGYYFPEPQPLRAQRAIQRGSWHDMSDSQSAAEHAHPFLTLWFDHGAQAKGAAYAYALLPRKTAAETEAFAASGRIEVLAHNSRAHAVHDRGRNALGVVFWQPGTVGKLSADRACLAYYEESAEQGALAISDPTHATSTFRVTIAEALTPVDLAPELSSEIVNGRTVVTCRAEQGQNYVARFALTR
jgi:hyaluronate lyase